MKHNLKLYSKGFTLTEVLLAVMIVGLIGVALAALTRASAREGGVGRSRIMLRNNAASFLRTLRRDINQATAIDEVGGGYNSVATNAPNALLIKLRQGNDINTERIPIRAEDGTNVAPNEVFITYCFQGGTDTNNIVPAGASRGGTIWRVANAKAVGAEYIPCSEISSHTGEDGVSVDEVLNHVKFIPADEPITLNNLQEIEWPVPYFRRKHNLGNVGSNLNIVQVSIITELNSDPIVNDFIEETFAAPVGY